MSQLPFIIIMATIGTLTQFKENIKTYSVKKITGAPKLTGGGADPFWKAAPTLDDFQYPWEEQKAPSTKFKALHNEEWFYCLFDVADPAVFIQQEKNHKTEVASSSRAEIFFKSDDRMRPYYCLELDPMGRILDYEATYHRNFNFSWSWPANGVIVMTERRDDGYSIEVAISKSSLKALGLMHNNTLQAGIFRGDCLQNSDGKLRFRWISWVKPDSKTPDFHIPSSFGLLLLEE